MKKIWETGIILFSVMGFWGMIYPDLCFTQDVCGVVQDDGENMGADNGDGKSWPERSENEEETGLAGGTEDGLVGGGYESLQGLGGEDFFTGLCGAAPGQIRLKSRLYEMIKSESKGNSDGAKNR